jgi:hypothetical protein
VDEKFDQLPISQQGGPVFLTLIYNVIFIMTEPVEQVLQKWIKICTKQGLCKIPGKNVCTFYDAAFNICKRLHEVGSLLNNAATDILECLTKATNKNFIGKFFILQKVSNKSTLDIGGVKNKTTFDRIKIYRTQALDSYIVHIVDRTWTVKRVHGLIGEVICWNCSKGGHAVNKCPQPLNKERIEKARGKFNKKKSTLNNNCFKKGGNSGDEGGDNSCVVGSQSRQKKEETMKLSTLRAKPTIKSRVI